MRSILLAMTAAVLLVAAPLALAAKPDSAGKPDTTDTPSAAAGHHGTVDQILAAMKEVRQGCRGSDTPTDHANMTKDEHRSWAHCVRDGYRGIFALFHVGHHKKA